jgi:hypothetical protein
LSFQIEAGLCHLLFDLAADLLDGGGDGVEVVEFLVENKDALFYIVAAEALAVVSARTSSDSVYEPKKR